MLFFKIVIDIILFFFFFLILLYYYYITNNRNFRETWKNRFFVVDLTVRIYRFKINGTKFQKIASFTSIACIDELNKNVGRKLD